MIDGLTFEAPGPGSWEVENVHFPRPLSRVSEESAAAEHFFQGFREGARRYGALIDGPRTVPLHRFSYSQILPAGRKHNGGGPPPRLMFSLLLKVVPELRARRRNAERAMEDRIWRDEVKEWEERDKPANRRRHTELLAVDLPALSDEQLIQHIQEVIEQRHRMERLHARYTVPSMAATGDLMVHVHRWTGLSVPEQMPLVAGASPATSGWVPEADPLIDALRQDATQRAILDSDRPPGEILDMLLCAPAPVGDLVRAYVNVVGYRVVGGYDVTDPLALEQPELLVEGLRQLVAAGRKDDSAVAEEAAEEIRGRLPAAHHAQFTDLLQEARHSYYLRDERGLFADLWATGIARRAMLEAGRRLQERGAVATATHATEAGGGELAALLRGEPGPSAEALADRDAFRRTYTFRDVPAALGAPPSPPPPLEWLPGALRRVNEAAMMLVANVFDEPSAPAAEQAPGPIRGRSACRGVYEGVARIIAGPEEFHRIQPGDVLVTTSTSPTFNIVLPRIGAIVTDHGGVLSHAAIVAREYGLPAVVGCHTAVKTIPDGARVRVDAEKGEVSVL